MVQIFAEQATATRNRGGLDHQRVPERHHVKAVQVDRAEHDLRTNHDHVDPGPLLDVATRLFGGDVDNQERSGARFGAGAWLDDDGRLGVEAGYLFLGTRSVGLSSGSPGVAGVYSNP